MTHRVCRPFTPVHAPTVLATLGLASSLTGCAVQSKLLVADIHHVLDQQVAAWNSGDIDGFMAGYWRSEELSFSSGGRTTFGWDGARERYRTSYPTPDRMGTLEFSDIQVTPLGPDTAIVLGRWRITKVPDPAAGNFTLVFKPEAGRWVIVHDHTSVDAHSKEPAESVDAP